MITVRCGGCNREIVDKEWLKGLLVQRKAFLPPTVAGRVGGKPYCPVCYARMERLFMAKRRRLLEQG